MSVSVISVASRGLAYLSNISSNFLRQSYESKKLYVVLRSDTLNERDVHRFLIGAGVSYQEFHIIKLPSSTSLGQCYAHPLVMMGDYWAKFDEEHYYGITYLEEKIKCLEQKKAHLVGQNHFFCYDPTSKEFSIRKDKILDGWSDWIRGPTLVMKKEVFSAVSFSDQEKGYDSQFLREAKQKKIRIYAHYSKAFVYVLEEPGLKRMPLIREKIIQSMPFLVELYEHVSHR